MNQKAPTIVTSMDNILQPDMFLKSWLTGRIEFDYKRFTEKKNL